MAGASAVCGLLALGCSGGADPDASSPPTAGDGGSSCPASIPAFFAGATSGLEALGVNGAVKARVVVADPTPPERFRNDWTVLLMHADGTPLVDAQIVKACARMPTHPHSAPPRGIRPLAEPGQFALDDLNFVMRGGWQVQLAVTADSIPDVSAPATVCDSDATGRDYVELEVCVRDD